MFLDVSLEGLVVLADAKVVIPNGLKVHSSQQGNKDYKKSQPTKTEATSEVTLSHVSHQLPSGGVDEPASHWRRK